MRPLTLKTPKPLLLLAGQPILAHIILALPDAIDELIIVIGYLGEQIQTFFGNPFRGRPVRYLWQREKLGTAHALRLAEPYIRNERFLVLCADDLHGKAGLEACLRHSRSLLIAEHAEPERFGVVELAADGTIAAITEKPARPKSNLVSTGTMVLDGNIFNYEPVRHENGEYYLTGMFGQLIRHLPVAAEKTGLWFPIAAPGDIAAAERFLDEIEPQDPDA